MSLFTLAAITVSSILLLLLYRGDPKRRRSARLPGKGQSQTHRRLLTAAALVPGLICIARGDAAAFLLWLGGCAVMGWIFTVTLSGRTGNKAI
ncbi:MAG: hypothetical protein ABW169_03155 [Sphingobium sp.]